MTDTFEFTCSPLLRDQVTVHQIPLPVAYSPVPPTPESLDGQSIARRNTGFGSFPFGLTSLGGSDPEYVPSPT